MSNLSILGFETNLSFQRTVSWATKMMKAQAFLADKPGLIPGTMYGLLNIARTSLVWGPKQTKSFFFVMAWNANENYVYNIRKIKISLW